MENKCRSIMFQGTGSDVGKSVLVAGLCRLAHNRGLKVVPFKPQNMSNNAAVAAIPDSLEQGEIGRAQWLQALACGIDPHVHMNPVLLKPQSEIGSQIVVHGKVWGEAKGADYQKFKPALLEKVLQSFEYCCRDADLVIIEGAGSPAEINLRQGDIANMGFAEAADVPVVLVGDIDRGGVIASLVGTHTILPEADGDRIVGYLINKFRGDVSLFGSGVEAIKQHTGWPCFGIVPWLEAARLLPEEDSVALERPTLRRGPSKEIRIVVPILPRIANFDEFDPFKVEPEVDLILLKAGEDFPEDADLIILPGSKSTIADLEALRARGWDKAIIRHGEKGGKIVGICGGYQMLGAAIHDPDGLEGTSRSVDGLGLLQIETIMVPAKTVRTSNARSVQFDIPVAGYEIHMGVSTGNDARRPMLEIDGHAGGAISALGNVAGCYLHGLFGNDEYRQKLMLELGATTATGDYLASVNEALDDIAEQLDRHLDPQLLAMMGI